MWYTIKIIAREVESKEIGIVIELKYAGDADFDVGCRKAIQQIKNRNYEEVLVKAEHSKDKRRKDDN